MPFGEYRDFDDCVAKNQQAKDPNAYCAEIKRRIEKDEGVGLHDYPTVGASLNGKICKTCATATLLETHKCSAPDTCLCLACLVDDGVDPELVARAFSASQVIPAPQAAPMSPRYEEALPYPCDYCKLRFPSYEKKAQHIGTEHPEKMKREETEEISKGAEQFYEASASLIDEVENDLFKLVAAEMDRSNPTTEVTPTQSPFTKQLKDAAGVMPVDTAFNKFEGFEWEAGFFVKALDQISAIVDNFEEYMNAFGWNDHDTVEAYNKHRDKLGNDWIDTKDPPKSKGTYWSDTKKLIKP